MKRNCNGCKALYIDRYYCTCELGYRMTKEVINKNLMLYNYKPAEECPKPKTYNEFKEANQRLMMNLFMEDKKR